MAKASKSNKNSASEDEIGLLHNMVTRIFKAKLNKWLQLIEDGGDVELIVDMSQLNNVIKFIDAQGIVATDADADTKSELTSQIDEIKEAQRKRLEGKNVVPFQSEEDDYQEFG